MMDSEAILRLLSMLTQGGRGQATAGPIQPPTQLPPDYAARQLLGGGVLGQGLSQQRAALNDPVAALAAAAGSAARPAPAALPQVDMPPGGVFYRPDDPSTMDPAQLIAYMKAHGIKKPSALDNLVAYLQQATQPATAAASSGAKSLSSIFGGAQQ